MCDRICKCLQDPERTLGQQIEDAQLKAHQSLLDNLNTKGALVALFDLMKGVNEYIAHREKGGGVWHRCVDVCIQQHLPSACGSLSPIVVLALPYGQGGLTLPAKHFMVHMCFVCLLHWFLHAPEIVPAAQSDTYLLPILVHAALR